MNDFDDPLAQWNKELDDALNEGRRTGDYTPLHNKIGAVIPGTRASEQADVPDSTFYEQKERIPQVIIESKLQYFESGWLRKLDQINLQDKNTSREIYSDWSTEIADAGDRLDITNNAYEVRRVLKEVLKLSDFLKD